MMIIIMMAIIKIIMVMTLIMTVIIQYSLDDDGYDNVCIL